jgi:hypothetical protein
LTYGIIAEVNLAKDFSVWIPDEEIFGRERRLDSQIRASNRWLFLDVATG